MKNPSKRQTEINAGTMADIAFLLLVFFLVVTRIEIDKGINLRLPAWKVEGKKALQEDDVLKIIVNGKEQILINNRMVPVREVEDEVLAFLQSKQVEKLRHTMVHLDASDRITYGMYIRLYDAILRGFHQRKDEISLLLYGHLFDRLSSQKDKKHISGILPVNIREEE